MSSETLNISVNDEKRQYEKGTLTILENKKAIYLESSFSIYTKS